MSYGFGPLAHLGLEQAAKLEYETFRREKSDHAALGQANWHRHEAQKWMKKGGKKGHQKALEHLGKAGQIETHNTANVNRAYIQESIGQLNARWSNGSAGDDRWAHASFQARMKAAFGEFRATGGGYAEFQQRVLAGVQNPYFRSALLGHPGLA